MRTLRLLGRHAGALWLATVVVAAVALGALLSALYSSPGR